MGLLFFVQTSEFVWFEGGNLYKIHLDICKFICNFI